MSEEPKRPSPVASASRAGALLVTNATKVAGAVIAVNEALTTKDGAVLLLAAFMMAGAQVSEGLLLALIDRFLGRESPEK